MITSDNRRSKSPEDIQTIASVADEVPCDEILGLVLNNLPYKNAGSNEASTVYDPATEDGYKSHFIERKYASTAS